MVIRVAFRQRYIGGITRRHQQHKQSILKLFHKIRSHPAFFKPGYLPSRAGVPKSIPKKPAGLNAKGSGFWDHVKKGWSWVKSKFHQHKGKVYEAAKKHGMAVGSRLLEAGKKAGSQAVNRAIEVAERNVEHYTAKAEAKLQGLADRAEAKIASYDRPKAGSGWKTRAAALTHFPAAQAALGYIARSRLYGKLHGRRR